ncbi:MAG: hypothetical protein J6I76_18330 [Oribacterium sp.]|nr:hypothetical protein [Oribacterium sp.]
MKKGIIIGNGFSSQIISGLRQDRLLRRVNQEIPEDMQFIESYFDSFRVNPAHFETKDYRVLEYDDAFIDEEDISYGTWWVESEHINSQIHDSIFNSLNRLGMIGDEEKIIEDYFVQTGLYEEIFNSHISNIESPIKIINLINDCSNIDKYKYVDSYIRIYDVLVNALYNDGDIHIKKSGRLLHKEKININKAKEFFSEYERIFTTNYDLILDDMNLHNLYHLHGAFNILKDSRKWRKSNYLDNSSSYLIILAASATDKKWYASGNNHKSEIDRYFKLLSNDEIEEIHLFGFSGLNDQHIMRAVSNNKNIQKIVYFGNPQQLFYERTETKLTYLMAGDHQRVEYRSWDDVWKKIR